ncbi:MAG: hypothetical protein J3T61_01305, partial [Candidatus Brocadiales bacterium]|nr:hypothetical protein [Candidatus Bathyanammoxibius sp.]
MRERKQITIDTLTDEIEYLMGGRLISDREVRYQMIAERMYSRIAPLIRGEFPEEEFRELSRRYRESQDRFLVQAVPTSSAGYTFQQMIADFKRL